MLCIDVCTGGGGLICVMCIDVCTGGGGLICVMCIDVCTGGGGAYDIYNKVLITYTLFIVHTLLCIILISCSYCAYNVYSIVYCLMCCNVSTHYKHITTH